MASYSSYSAEELVRACVANGERSAWREFFRRFQPVIAKTALRTARQWGEPEKALVDDLVQEIYLKLCDDDCRLLRNFQARHPDSIYGFLKKVAMNTVRDHFKAARTEKRGALQNHVPIAGNGEYSAVEVATIVDMDRALLLQEIQGHLERLLPGPEKRRERVIFTLYYRHGLTAPAIAAMPGISLTTKGVESTLQRLTRSLREALAHEPRVARTGCSAKGWSAANSS